MKTNMLKLLSVVILLIILVIGCKKNQTSTTEEKSNPINIQKIESVVKYCTDRVQNSLKTTDVSQLIAPVITLKQHQTIPMG